MVVPSPMVLVSGGLLVVASIFVLKNVPVLVRWKAGYSRPALRGFINLGIALAFALAAVLVGVATLGSDNPSMGDVVGLVRYITDTLAPDLVKAATAKAGT